MSYKKINSILNTSKCLAKSPARFFKTGVGEYAEHDQFIGVPVPTLRKIAHTFSSLPLLDLQKLLKSPENEKRFLSLLILIKQYQKGTIEAKHSIYQFYINHLNHVNNWNLVDASAHLIIGNHLLKSKKHVLLSLSTSSSLWDRRIAIVATWYFIRHHQFDWTLKIAKVLLNDSHDLIHKAVGWMLREVGKRDVNVLIEFLDQYASKMPRTMLRYAIEKLSIKDRTHYLKKVTKV